MNIDFLKHEIIDSQDNVFSATVFFIYEDEFMKKHKGFLKVSNCSYLKDNIRKDSFVLEQIGLDEDVTFQKETLEDDLGFELIDMIKNNLVFYFKTYLKF